MVNIRKLKGKIVENDLSIAELAKKIGIDRSTLYRKLAKNGDDFSIKEANLITRELKLSQDEAVAIFFNQSVA